MQIKNQIPNTITALNIVFGTMAVMASFGALDGLFALQGHRLAALLIALAAVADFLDGFAARLLGAVSPIGKELDSLCDLVSFGVAPAMIVFNLMRAHDLADSWLPLLTLLIVVAGALRLARFNVDTRQATSFIGLPIPANAIFWIGFAWYYAGHAVPVWLVAVLIVALSWLMVSPLPMFSLKLHSLAPREAWRQYLLVITAVVLFAVMGVASLAVTIAVYVLLSAVLWIVSPAKN